MSDQFHDMARELAALIDERDDVCEAGFGCHFHPVYGFVPEADCPVHDLPNPHSPTPESLP